MKVKLLPWQTKIAEDEHRFRIVCAGRRAGKSVLARMIVLKWATQKEGLYWIVSPTYKQAKMIHWAEIRKEIPQDWVTSTNQVELSVELKNGSKIALKGAENPDTLRGVKLRGLVIDEIASIKNWDWLWEEVLRPTLVDYQAPAIFISTPKGYNHFYDLYQLGQSDDPDYESWKYTSYDNPQIPDSEIDAAKRTTTADFFAQEYLADFRKYTGLIYKEFNRDIHIINPIDIPNEWEIYAGFDFGSNNPTAIVWIAVDNDDNWYIVNEHYSSGRTIDFHAGVYNSSSLKNRVITAYGDPSGKQWISEFQQRGIYITPANKETGTSKKNWVNFGIEKVAEKLRRIPGHINGYIDFPGEEKDRGLPSLYVFKSCKHTIEEFETYRWKEKSESKAADLNEPDKPEKAMDHLMDCIRYFAVSYNKQPDYLTPRSDLSNKNWNIGG